MYEAPSWKRIPNKETEEWYFNVKRGEQTLGYVNLNEKDHFVLGREGKIDHIMLHPTTSRQHAIIQHGEDSAFVYDCNSTHGTFLNGDKIEPGKHIKLKIGDQLRFGGSSRAYVLSFKERSEVPEEKTSRKRKLEEIQSPENPRGPPSQPQNVPAWGNFARSTQAADTSMSQIRNSWGSQFKKSSLTADNPTGGSQNTKMTGFVSASANDGAVQKTKIGNVPKGFFAARSNMLAENRDESPSELSEPPKKKSKLRENLEKRLKEKSESKFGMLQGGDRRKEQEDYFEKMRARNFGGMGGRRGF